MSLPRATLAAILALVLAACGSRQTPPRMEPLVSPPSGVDAALCTQDGAWCLAKTPRVDGIVATYRSRTIATIPFADGEHAAWPFIVRARSANGSEEAIIGLLTTVERSYSGGGGSATHVDLYPVYSTDPDPDPYPHALGLPVLNVPIAGAIDIRACFSEADTLARRDACSDQYNFTGTLALAEGAQRWPPRFLLTTEATTFPGRRSRTETSTGAQPLAADDLKTARDEACSYRRVFTFGLNGTYTPDAPLPACEDYLQP